MKRKLLSPVVRLVTLIVEVVDKFVEDDCPQRAAALAYYAVLSLPPLLILIVTLGSTFLDPQVVEAAVQEKARNIVAPRATEQLLQMVHSAGDWASTGPWWAIGLSVLGVLFGATRAFAQLQTALNRAWSIEPPAGNVLRRFLAKRLVSFGALGAMGAILVVSIVLKAMLERFDSFAAALLPEALFWTFQWLSGHTLSIVYGTAFLASLYWLLPDAKIPWKAVIPGALLTALTFDAMGSLLSLYLASLRLDDAFGQAGSFAVLLIWLYLCALLLLFGAEFTQVWSKNRSIWPEPDEDETSTTRKSATEVLEDLKDKWGLGTNPPARPHEKPPI